MIAINTGAVIVYLHQVVSPLFRHCFGYAWERFAPVFLTVFPDHAFPRAVLAVGAYSVHIRVVWRIPAVRRLQ